MGIRAVRRGRGPPAPEGVKAKIIRESIGESENRPPLPTEAWNQAWDPGSMARILTLKLKASPASG